MNFARIGSSILLGSALCMVLMASKCDNSIQQSSGNTQGTTTETQTGATTAPAGTIDVHTVWPTANEHTGDPVADDPFRDNYMLVIDTSGSMGNSCGGEDKLVTAKTAAIEFIDNIPADAAIGLVQFGNGNNGGVEIVVALGANQHQVVRDAVANLRAGGGTPMAGGIYSGYQELLRGGSAQLGYGTYAMAILGDGSPGDANQTIENIDYIVQQTRIDVTTIGFCTDLEQVMNRAGVSYFTASTLDELSAAFGSILVEAESFVDINF